MNAPVDHPFLSEQGHLWLLPVVLLGGVGWYASRHRAEAVAQAVNEEGVPATPPPGAPRHLAPERTFYILHYVSVRTANGLTGFEPGCEVHLKSVNQAKRSLPVTDGKSTVEVSPAMVTNDLDIANLARWQDERGQQAIASYQHSEQTAYQDAADKLSRKHGDRVQRSTLHKPTGAA